jgi:hypothetical protein
MPTLPLDPKTVILVVELVMILRSLFDRGPKVPVAERLLPPKSHGVPPNNVVVEVKLGALIPLLIKNCPWDPARVDLKILPSQ